LLGAIYGPKVWHQPRGIDQQYVPSADGPSVRLALRVEPMFQAGQPVHLVRHRALPLAHQKIPGHLCEACLEALSTDRSIRKVLMARHDASDSNGPITWFLVGGACIGVVGVMVWIVASHYIVYYSMPLLDALGTPWTWVPEVLRAHLKGPTWADMDVTYQ